MTDKPTANPPTFLESDFTKSRADYQRRAAETVAENKKTIFDVLAGTPITRIVIDFDGYGDSGQIESVLVETNDQTTELPDKQVEITSASFRTDEIVHSVVSLREALETLVYGLLEQTHSGWEDNEGAFGAFIFEVAKRAITLDYDERFLDTTHSHHIF